MELSHLTDEELINQLTLRDDLTRIEHELLDRLIRMERAMSEISAFDGESAQMLEMQIQFAE